MTDPVIYAAAYLLLIGQPVQAPEPVPTPIASTILCQLPPAPHKLANNPPGHISVRWNDPPRHWRHRRRCFRWGRGWRCR